MSTCPDAPQHDVIPERFWVQLEQLLQTRRFVSYENGRLRKEIQRLQDREQALAAYESTYNQTLDSQDQLIRELHPAFTDICKPSVVSDDIPIDPNLSLNNFNRDISNSLCYVSTASKIEQKASCVGAAGAAGNGDKSIESNQGKQP